MSYQRLAEAFIVLYEDVRSIALAAPGTHAATEAVDRARRDKTWDNALVAVWLHGSAPVASAATVMDRVVTEPSTEYKSGCSPSRTGTRPDGLPRKHSRALRLARSVRTAVRAGYV
ncbi:hypothetical protein OG948_57420 (plasmid) [Embleya sp. NBC_00888]|uniref:hypothetical protein n=1 Tax=Embleya sp. NBC_00888 TaxID=2975960 RepID=UPI003870B3C0|nr:hypothetical protein OG948_57420 [Embleya sp. NBC_00888]